jgi:putative membrane protein
MGKIIVLVSAFVLWLLDSTPSYAQWGGYGDWGWSGPGMMGWGWWGFGWIFMIIFWGLIIAGLILLIRWLVGLSRSHTPYNKDRDSALEILRQRYAKGEIDKEEFDQKKKDLM